MSGETEEHPSSWTPDLLFIHLQQQLNAIARLTQTQIEAMTRMLDERYATQTKALDAAFVAQQDAMKTALAAAEKAVTTANTANEKRFESVNEFRGQLNDIVSKQISRAEADVQFSALDKELRRLSSLVETGFAAQRASKSAGKDSWGYLVGAVGLLAAFVTMTLQLVGR